MTFIKIDPDRILHNVRNMRDDVNLGTLSKEDLKEKYKYLHINSIHLFDMVCANNYNYLPLLKIYIDELKKIKDTKTKDKADAKIGVKIANRLLYPSMSRDTLERENIDINNLPDSSDEENNEEILSKINLLKKKL